MAPFRRAPDRRMRTGVNGFGIPARADSLPAQSLHRARGHRLGRGYQNICSLIKSVRTAFIDAFETASEAVLAEVRSDVNHLTSTAASEPKLVERVSPARDLRGERVAGMDPIGVGLAPAERSAR
jgi:hypothetical protein